MDPRRAGADGAGAARRQGRAARCRISQRRARGADRGCRAMKRFPVVATISVGLAIVVLIALGIWQLQRRAEKEALLAHLAANQHLAPIAFPAIPVGDDLLFRRASVMCLRPVAWQSRGGRDAAGNPGWREIASCSTGAEGPGVMIQ